MTTYTLYGSTGDDDILGSELDEIVYGGPNPIFHLVDIGNDLLNAVTGSDTVYGLGGNDTIRAGGGSSASDRDYLYGGSGDDTLISTGGQEVHLYGGTGNDSMRSDVSALGWVHYDDAPGRIVLNLGLTGPQDTLGSGIDTIVNVRNAAGSGYDDTLQTGAIGSYTYTLAGNGGGDSLFGHQGKDILLGGNGDDTIDSDGGGTNAAYDVLDGGAGNDTADFIHATGELSLRLDIGQGVTQNTFAGGIVMLVGIENLAGADLEDAIVGDGAANILSGRGGDDSLYGLGGDDRLVGGAGDDILNGGSGIDSVSYENFLSVGVQVDLSLGYATGGAGTDQLTDIENAVGSSRNDLLVGNSKANTLDGGAGYDSLYGHAGDDIFVLHSRGRPQPDEPFIYDRVIEAPGEGTDTVLIQRSTGEPQTVYALPDNVENGRIDGLVGFSLSGNTLENFLTGNSGDDALAGLAGGDTLHGAGGLDRLEGGEGDDTLWGEIANDVLVGGNGADFLAGGDGNDIYVDPTGDAIAELPGQGIDVVQSGIGFSLAAIDNVERLVLTGTGDSRGIGNALANLIAGNGGANVLSGLDGADKLDGGNGDDLLIGGYGDDTLVGGSGADTYRFAGANTGTDRILDFNRKFDRFDLDGGTFSAVTTAGTNTTLTHAGGKVIVVGVTGLSLADWNDFVGPDGGRAAAHPPGADLLPWFTAHPDFQFA